MKKQTLMAFTLAATTLIGTSAFAADGVITFTGQIKDATCDVSTSAGAGGAPVVIPAVAKTNLDAVGKTGPNHGFDIILDGTGCTDAQAQVSFEQDPLTINPDGTLKNTNTTTGGSVVLQLMDSTGAVIDLNDPTYKTPVEPIGSNKAVIPMSVRYKATAEAVSGIVEAKVGVVVNTF